MTGKGLSAFDLKHVEVSGIGEKQAALEQVGYKKPVVSCRFSVLSLFLRRMDG